MTKDEAMQMALDVLQALNKDGWILADFENQVYAATDALRTALAQPDTQIGITYEEANPPQPYCKRCGKKLGTEVTDVHTCTPKRDFKFSTIEEAMQPIPTPKVQPQLTNDEARFANAFIALQKAGYGKEAEIVLKCKPVWQGLTDQEIEEGQKQSWVDKQAFESAVWWAEAKLKEKNSD